jgi:hypothetical protein
VQNYEKILLLNNGEGEEVQELEWYIDFGLLNVVRV